ncbi:MAG: terminase small subunit [Epibacterium sp.]|nr:terminase small subunit [Epibacterium sp.]NQX76060.1 terminase small subunit [Epibacterium sp.]
MSGDTAIEPLEDLRHFVNLNAKEQAVIVEYVTQGMASLGRAYAKIYNQDYNDTGVRSNASKFFKRPRIAAALKEYREAIAQERITEGVEVMAVLSDIIQGSVVDAIDDNGNVNLRTLREGRLRHLVKSIKYNRKDDSWEITPHNKVEAAKLLIQVMGFDQGRLQNRIDVNVLNVQVPGIGAGAGDAAQVVEQLNELPEGGES